MTSLFTMLILTIHSPITAGSPELEKARAEVWAFERKLHDWPKDKDAEREKAIRDFFGQL